MALSFRGGIHPEEAKRSAACPLEEMTAGDFVTIPLQQHIGVCASALVKAGDFVKKGQKIADGDGLCCPIHASVSGRVSSIGKVVTPAGDGLGIVIENDYREELCSTVQPFPKSLAEATTEELIGWIREKGIVGFGGATFPTWVKVQGAVGKVRRVVINCAECEPYLTSNHRLLVERAREVILGVRILNRIIGCDRAVFAIEDNKPDAAKELVSLLRGQKEISVSVFKTKYPQGDERQLVRALLKKEIPRGKLPADLGIVIFFSERHSSNALDSIYFTLSEMVTFSSEVQAINDNSLIEVEYFEITTFLRDVHQLKCVLILNSVSEGTSLMFKVVNNSPFKYKSVP